MKKLFWVILMVSVLGGCAGMDMKAYVGRSIQDVIFDYGPPAHEYTLGKGEKAFQWEMVDSYREPITASTTGFKSGIRHGGIINENTIYTGGGTHVQKCFYTYFARWNDVTKSWMITGFRKPLSGC